MTDQEALDLLRQSHLCRRLRADELWEIAGGLQRRHHAKGCLLPGLPATATTVVLVATGEVHRCLLSPDGREFALRSCMVGDLFALDERYPEMMAQAAEEDTVVWLAPGERFVDALRCNPEAVTEVLQMLWDEVLQQRRMLGEVASCNVDERLAHKLAELAAPDPKGRVSVSRAALAHLIRSHPGRGHQAATSPP